MYTQNLFNIVKYSITQTTNTHGSPSFWAIPMYSPKPTQESLVVRSKIHSTVQAGHYGLGILNVLDVLVRHTSKSFGNLYASSWYVSYGDPSNQYWETNPVVALQHTIVMANGKPSLQSRKSPWQLDVIGPECGIDAT